MSKIINFQEHIEIEKQKKVEEERKHSVDALRKVMVCFSCRMKCARCGVQVNVTPCCPVSADMPFNLCETCTEEYQEYKQALENQENQEIPWHNHEWKEMWRTWIEYQQSLKKYQTSKEVQALFKKD